MTSAWWVYDHQVSKTAPTGEYLTVGSFMVRGAKNFLPPNPLVMGFGLLFRFDESCLAAHLNERRVRGETEDDDKVNVVDAKNSRTEGVASRSKVSEEDGETEEGGGGSETLDSDADDDVGEDEQPSRGVVDSSIPLDMSDGDHSGAEAEGTDKDRLREGDGEDGGSTKKVSALDDLLDRALELRAAPKPQSHVLKYGLDSGGELSHEREAVVADPIPKAVQRERPYLSKAERRRLKKGGKPGGEDDSPLKEADEQTGHTVAVQELSDVDDKGVEDVKDEDESVSGGKDQRGADGSVRLIRGKKGKMKKMKEKYYDQDAEDRELRMSLLAVSDELVCWNRRSTSVVGMSA